MTHLPKRVVVKSYLRLFLSLRLCFRKCTRCICIIRLPRRFSSPNDAALACLRSGVLCCILGSFEHADPLSPKHMQILTSEPHRQGGDGALIVWVMPENAISGEIKWDRWSERKLSIFYEHFPLFPLGFLWLSASNRIPSWLIPFSKNVIRKSSLEFLLPRSLPPRAQQWCLTSSRFSLSFLLASVRLIFPQCPIGALTNTTFGCALCRLGCIIINSLLHLTIWVLIL